MTFQFLSPMTSTPINPFYDPGSAPPPIPVLSAHIPILYDQQRVSMVAHEELRYRSGNHRVNFRDTMPHRSPSLPTNCRYEPFARITPHRDNHTETIRTMVHRSRKHNYRSSLPSSEDGSTSDSSCPSDTSEVVSSVELIRKPRGTPGRPRSGGYNLPTAMKWKVTAYENL